MIKTPVRARARALAILVPLLCVLGVGGACTEELRTDGQACLKSNDCLSGVCANFVCVAAPTLLDAQVNGDGSLEAGPSEGGDTGSDTSAPDVVTPPKDSGPEAAPPMEAATDAGPDGSSMAEGGTDGSSE